ncbi:MAG: hypothetical protein EHM45_02720 [Desulfobacteraceae bacterium]|nr:MAG: hypothetical protein EHM45_02720 [Desulfobacteraceae bacterium]
MCKVIVLDLLIFCISIWRLRKWPKPIKNRDGIVVCLSPYNILDPRIPDHLERFPLIVETSRPVTRVEWFLDGQLLGITGANTNRYLWQPQRGRHTAYAKVLLQQQRKVFQTPEVPFWVK